ncbi:DUF523 domain-containing protein [Motilimonas pumila]|uniref:DUF523 domain-containing protein n=1 Tax=Motilimonas pumila TaxID=2303987 RepID=A0A418YH86_9GAMM|nr:DUF523 domain-containing protein [Motilimonas pumila]RJG49450.1 DUF523 domain-containing protein [Motilimonas pumila]
MEKVLVSACLLGAPVRYDGTSKAVQHPLLSRWQQEGRLIALCPEQAGGLSTPRAPAERQGERVITVQGQDVTAAFLRGAQHALSTCLRHNISFAILKENSPSCGVTQAYDGSFQGQLVTGEGVTTALLRQHGIAVFSEQQLERLEQRLKKILSR